MPAVNRRHFLTGLGAGTLAAAATVRHQRASAAPSARPSGKRPNVLFLISDDQRFDTIRALGNESIITPSFDALVRDGVTFTHAHIMGSTMGAVCVCSRSMLLTGRSLWRSPAQPAAQLPLLPEVLRDAGYTTFGIGKWHNGEATYARCFTGGAKIFFGGMSSHLKAPVADFDPSGKYPKADRKAGEKFSSELFSDAAIRFLGEYKEEKPFLLYVAYTAPHDPRMAPEKYTEMYPPEKVELPRNYLPEHPFDNGEMKVRDEQLAPWPRTPEIVRRHIADYYAMITHLDAQIGRVTAALRESRFGDNTIVIFAADNGLAVGRHGLFGKQNLYEHSLRVPLIFGGPGIPKDKRVYALCYLHDVNPTICELLELAAAPTVESRSLGPLLRGEKKEHRSEIFGAYRDVQRMIRNERFKLIEYLVEGKRTTQLFDLANDPWEINNLAAEPKCAEHVAALRKQLAGRQDELDDPMAGKFLVE